MRWEVEYTDQFEDWWKTLDAHEQASLDVAVEALEVHGTGLGRPFVDSIKGSRHRNMKELRPVGGYVRVLFAFDPRRMAILLIGGDKLNRWRSWYDEMLPVADELYEEHLTTLREEGLLP